MNESSFRRKVHNVLVIEDGAIDAYQLELALRWEQTPARMEVRRDPVQTLNDLRSARTTVPDVIVLNMELGRSHGFEILAELKACPSLEHVPVAMMTSTRSECETLNGYDREVTYVVRPQYFDEYLSLVDAVQRCSKRAVPEVCHQYI